MVGAFAATTTFANVQPSGVPTAGEDRKEQMSANPASEQPIHASAGPDSTGNILLDLIFGLGFPVSSSHANA
jgi:hypothetical protein